MRTKLPQDRFYYVLNDDSFQKIQIFVKLTTLKKLLLSYELCWRLVRDSNSPNWSYFPVRLNSYGRQCKGGTADHYSEQGAKIKQSLGSADFSVQNVGGGFEVSFSSDIFQQALENFSVEKSKEIIRWAGSEGIGVFTLLAQQQGRGNQRGKVVLEFIPCTAAIQESTTSTVDVWPVLVGVYANLRRQNKGSSNGPRGKRRRAEEFFSETRNVRPKIEEEKEENVSRDCEVALEVALVPVKCEVKEEEPIEESLIVDPLLLYTELTPDFSMISAVKEEPWYYSELFKLEDLEEERKLWLRTDEQLEEEEDITVTCWQSFLSTEITCS